MREFAFERRRRVHDYDRAEDEVRSQVQVAGCRSQVAGFLAQADGSHLTPATCHLRPVPRTLGLVPLARPVVLRDVGRTSLPAHNNRMSLRRSVLVAAFALGLAGLAIASNPAPKVSTTTQTPATMRAIQKSINCLVDYVCPRAPAPPRPARPTFAAAATLRWTRCPSSGHSIAGCIRDSCWPWPFMPVDNAAKSAIVTSGRPAGRRSRRWRRRVQIEAELRPNRGAVCNQAAEPCLSSTDKPVSSFSFLVMRVSGRIPRHDGFS